jgi:quercetin dioxygenase-like cupin family protein
LQTSLKPDKPLFIGLFYLANNYREDTSFMADNLSDNKMILAEPRRLDELVDYGNGAVVSRTLIKAAVGTITLFAFDANQELSEHTAPYDAFVEILDGQGEFTIGGKKTSLAKGEAIIMPANIPHAVFAITRFKMLLVMIKG